VVLVPPSLVIDGVTFPLAVNADKVQLARGADELHALEYLVEHLTIGAGKSIPIEAIVAGKPIEPPAPISALPTARMKADELRDGPFNWKRLSGRYPDLSDAYLVRTGFTPRKLAVPRAAFAELVRQVRSLGAEVNAGQREARVDDSMPVPPPPPITPEIVEHDRLRAISERFAQEFREMLAKLPPGTAWTPPAPDRDEDDE
jgi:hypothetical protein